MMASTIEQDEVLARESAYVGSDLAGIAGPQQAATEEERGLRLAVSAPAGVADPHEPATEDAATEAGFEAATTKTVPRDAEMEDAAEDAASQDAPAANLAAADPHHPAAIEDAAEPELEAAAEPEPAAPSGGAGAGYLHPDDLYKPDLGKPVWEDMGKAEAEQPVDYSNKPKGSELKGWDKEWNKSVDEPLSMTFPAPKTRTKLRRGVQTVYRDWSRRVWRRKAAYEQSVDDQKALRRLHVAATVARSHMTGAVVHEENKKYARDHQARLAKRRMEREQMSKQVQQETAKANAAAISKQVPAQGAAGGVPQESIRGRQEKEELRSQIMALAAKVAALEARQEATPLVAAPVVAAPVAVAPVAAAPVVAAPVVGAPAPAPAAADTKAKASADAKPAASTEEPTSATAPAVAEAASANATAAPAANSTVASAMASANMKYVQSNAISLHNP